MVGSIATPLEAMSHTRLQAEDLVMNFDKGQKRD